MYLLLSYDHERIGKFNDVSFYFQKLNKNLSKFFLFFGIRFWKKLTRLFSNNKIFIPISKEPKIKLQKLTTLPVPRWSPTLVLGKPVGA
jgi:hypothetical protein